MFLFFETIFVGPTGCQEVISMQHKENPELKQRFIVNACLQELFCIYQVPDFMGRCIQVSGHGFKQNRCRQTDNKGDFMATWSPKHKVLFFIYLNEDNQTLIGLDQKIYLASPDFMVSGFMPSRSCVIAQYTEDEVSVSEKIPKVLIFDMVMLDGESMLSMSPMQRYKVLLSNCSIKHNNHIFMIQWVGFERSVIEKFQEFKMTIPHEIDSIMRIGDDPMQITRILPLVTSNPLRV